MKQPAILIPPSLKEDGGRLLLHACCAPCSSAIVEWLLAHDIHPTIFYFNPNIWPREEYEIRKNESKRHAESLGIQWMDGDYDHDQWQQGVCGLENQPERGLRCEQCFTLRLTATAHKARELGIRFFATTLASSRWKSLEQIERAGLAAAQVVPGTEFWAQNWRKDGLQERRNQLLRENNFYNQQYCGCEFSVRNAAPTKELLRKVMREAKRQHKEQLPAMSESVVERLKSILLPYTPHCSTILAYWPLADEVDIRPLLDELLDKGNVFVLPKVIGDDTMELRRFTSRDDLQEGAFHIMEPVGEPFIDYDKLDVALIPGMAFDAAGHRLGRGRGYYDRFLAAHPDLHTIGVCFPFQRVPKVPFEDYDIAVETVV